MNHVLHVQVHDDTPTCWFARSVRVPLPPPYASLQLELQPMPWALIKVQLLPHHPERLHRLHSLLALEAMARHIVLLGNPKDNLGLRLARGRGSDVLRPS